MDELRDLFRELIEKMDEIGSTLREVAHKLDQVSNIYGIDDVVSKLEEVSSEITSKLDEVSSNITGPTMYNPEDLWKELSK